MRCEPETLAELKAIPLFGALQPAQLERLTAGVRSRRLEEGELLFHTGDSARHFFYLSSGAIKLFRNSPEGAEKVIDLVRPRQTFAEAVMFMERSDYPVSAEALERSVVLAFEQKLMLEMLRGSVDTCFRMLAALSRRLRQQVEEIDRLTLHTATFRLAAYLLPPDAACAAGPIDVRLDAPKHVIASRLAIQPETFSRILARLIKDEVIEVDGSRLRLHDIAALRELARS